VVHTGGKHNRRWTPIPWRTGQSVVGGDDGILIAAVAQIEATNLIMPQLKNIGTALLAY
jgi:hypothetical protein